MSSLNPVINEVVDGIGNIAREGREGAAAGMRSGYNHMKSAGWRHLFGIEHLEQAKSQAMKGYGTGKKAFKAAGGFSGEDSFKKAGDAAWKGVGDIGETAWKFASGHGFTGFARAGAIGARAGMLAGAAAAADFLNPFGFGSVRD